MNTLESTAAAAARSMHAIPPAPYRLCARCRQQSPAADSRLQLISTGKPARPHRIRDRATTGPNALTPSEHNVAVLAAQGLSNPQIAQTLFITRKTVEKHLGNAYLKLQITSRYDLLYALTAGPVCDAAGG